MISARNSVQYWPSLGHLAKKMRSPGINSHISLLKYDILPPGNGNVSVSNIPAASPQSFPLPGSVSIDLPKATPAEDLETLHKNRSDEENVTFSAAAPLQRLSSEVDVHSHECSNHVKQEIRSLFPGKEFKSSLTAITVALHTENDMLTWNTAVADEREILTTQFISTALELCSILRAEGYFADFIDPSSGRPFMSQEYTPNTLFETDPIQRHFGVDVKDLGCCKAVYHAVWGSKVFTGTMITDAPSNSPIIESMTSPANSA